MALLLSVDRHIADGAADLRGGQWNKGRYSQADGLHGKRMATIGLGEIGLSVAERACAFGIQVVAMLEPLNHRGFRLGADVWNDEPKAKAGEFASPLAQHRSVVGSHHIGASTEQTQDAVASGVVDVVMRFAQGGVANCVNPRPATQSIRVPAAQPVCLRRKCGHQ